MKTIEARFRIVTPIFIGDAEQKATAIRPPSIKGALPAVTAELLGFSMVRRTMVRRRPAVSRHPWSRHVGITSGLFPQDYTRHDPCPRSERTVA